MNEALGGTPDVVIYNASARVRGPLVELDPADVARALAVTAYGGFLVAQAAAKPRPSGCCHTAAAQFCLRAPRPASKVTRARRRSRWESSHCAGWRRASPASLRRRAFMWRIS